MQFVQDASIERYLEAAKLVADHAVIGAGPLEFYADAGKTGLRALGAQPHQRALRDARAFASCPAKADAPFGLDRYGKAFYVAWYYKHRVALGDPTATIRGLAAKEGITGRFADHIWTVVNKPNTGYPTRETVDGWMKLPAPTADVAASIAKARAGCDELYKALTTWPSWFFARGDLAAGGAGDESPLVFDDTTLKAERDASLHVRARPRGGARPRRGADAGRTVEGVSDVHEPQSEPGRDAGRDLAQSARRHARRPPDEARRRAAGAPARCVGARRRRRPSLSTQSLRDGFCRPTSPRRFAFGTSPDGTAIGPDDFATTGTVSFDIDAPPPATIRWSSRRTPSSARTGTPSSA